VRRAVRHAGVAALAALLWPALATGADRPSYGGELRVALPVPPRVADPALAREPQDLWLARALHATPLGFQGTGELGPGLLERVPEPQQGGRTFQLTLRDGLRFSDGTPLTARDLAASLARLLRPEVGSPHAWVAVALQGADEVVAGRAAALPGVQVLSDRELLVTLAFPFPAWPAALAALPAAVVSPAGAGAGPFRRDGRDRLVASELHWRGRPYADALAFSAPDPRAAAQGLEAGAIDLVARPEGTSGLPQPRLVVALAAVNGRRLGPGGAVIRRVLATLDRQDLVRRFVRAQAEPLDTLLPDDLVDGPVPAPAPAAAGLAPARLTLILPAWLADARAVADRLQVRLFDAGVKAALEPLDPARLAARLAAGEYDVALVVVPLLSGEPALAAGQVAGTFGGPRAARRAEQLLAGVAAGRRGEVLEQIRAELDLWPLYAAGGRLRPAAGVGGICQWRDGSLDPGDLWRAPAPAAPQVPP
jgi:peptide/nickel transport system substrate-binding protein